MKPTDDSQPNADARRHPKLTRWALHPLAHAAGLIGLHITALLVIDKTPLLALFGLH
jgi:hypothetical protein